MFWPKDGAAGSPCCIVIHVSTAVGLESGWGGAAKLGLGSRKGKGPLGWAGPPFYVFSHPSTHLIPTRLSEVGIITPISQMGKQIWRGRMTSSRSSGWCMEAWEMWAGARPRPEERRRQNVARSRREARR